MIGAVGAVGGMPDEGSSVARALASARVEAQARQLQQYVQTGGGEPLPPATLLAQLSAGPIPVDQVQQVQALLAETRRLAASTSSAPPPSPAERAERFRSD